VITAIRADRQLRHQLFDSFLEGFGLIHNRLRRVMASEQITHIACEGLEVDPDLMTVVELVDEPKDRPGTVAKELRRGYTWQGRILRFAEVQAVRAGPKALAEFAGAETRKSEEPPLGADDQAETTDGPAVLAEGPTP
jgi:molecular chaperone GrpE